MNITIFRILSPTLTTMFQGAVGMKYIPRKLTLTQISQNLFVHNINFCCLVIWKLCTELNCVGAVLCAKFQNDWTTEIEVMNNWDFVWFESNTSFWGIFCIATAPRGAFLTLIPAWISNYIPSDVWDEITYPFTNFNGATIEVWEWISNFIQPFIMVAITYPCWY